MLQVDRRAARRPSRDAVPGLVRWSVPFALSTGLVTLTLVWTTAARWRAYADPAPSRWSVRAVGRFVVAVRLDASHPR